MRRSIAWIAIVVGGFNVSVEVLTALSIAKIFDTQIRFGGWNDFLDLRMGSSVAGHFALLIGGAMLSRGRDAGLWMIRSGALALTIYALGDTVFNIAIHMGVLPAQPAQNWRTNVWDAMSRLTWVFGTPFAICLFSLVLPAKRR